MNKVFVVRAKHQAEQSHQIVGIFSTDDIAHKRLNEFRYGFVLMYEIDEPVLFNED